MFLHFVQYSSFSALPHIPMAQPSGSIVMRVNEGSVTEVRGPPPTSPPSSAVADTVKTKGLKLKVHLTAAQWETR